MVFDRTLSSTDRATQERTLMDDYVRGTGQDPQLIRARTDDVARMLLMSAAAFAASRLRHPIDLVGRGFSPGSERV